MSILSLFRRRRFTYNRLSTENDDGQESPTVNKSQLPKKDESSTVFYLTLFCVVCTLLNLIIIRVEEYRSIQQTHPTNLRRPSQFIGLDRVKRPSTPDDRSIVNFPFIVGLVDESRPSSVVPNTRRGLKTHEEISAPEATQIQVTKSISTVVQFRALDWGMESCELTLRLPSDETAVRTNSTLVLGGRLNDVDIYRLISDKTSSSLDTVIDQRKLSYQTRPTLGEKVGSVSVDYGTEWTYKFPCTMDSLHAFALVAADDSALIEWWQDKQSLEPALYISQYATK